MKTRQTAHASNMAAKLKIVEKYGVDAYVPDESVKVPLCSHGPTILFERFFKDRSSRRYFACSASRDRKGCPFFQWEDEKVTAGKEIIQKDFLEKLQKEKQSVEDFRKCREEAMNSKKNLIFCIQCSCIFLDSDKSHDGHKIKRISKGDLDEPSKYLLPAENKKTNAQYFFSESSCSLIVNLLVKLGYERIISLGVPRVHEKLKKMRNGKYGKPDTILLDIDKRYAQFLPQTEFFHYNMFNNYFYGGEEAENFVKTFMVEAEKGKVALVMDPPFGGLMSILAGSMNKLLSRLDNESPFDVENIAIMMIFPYFLESHVTEALPSLKMMDYKVCYENHPTFKQRSSERGSPIRIYTNISGEDFVLPKAEGYRLCTICKRYVSKENRHCQKCNSCSSKDGRTYIHCEQCSKCVKPDRVHCPICQSCEQKDHDCEKKAQNSLLTCHICGEAGHKRRECPQRATEKSLKRKSTDSNEVVAKKGKKTKKMDRKGQRKRTINI